MILVPHREDRWGIYGHKGRIFRRAGYWSGSVSGVGVAHRRIVHAILCDHPEGDVLMVHGVHAAHDLQVLAGAACMTLACAGFKAAPSLLSMCIRQMWRKGSGLRPLPKVATKSSDGQE